MAGTRKWWSVKAIGLNPYRPNHGVWFNPETRIAQITKDSKHGTQIIGAVAVYSEGV